MLNKLHRLTKKKEFDQVFKNGQSSYNKILGIKIINNELNYNRFGIMVSSNISKRAVDRNRIKRQIREIVRLQLNKMKKGKDCVIITQPTILQQSYQAMEKSIAKHFQRLSLYKDSLNKI